MKRQFTLGVGFTAATAIALAGCSSTSEPDATGAQKDSSTTGGQVTAVTQPDNGGAVITNAIKSAKVSVDIPIYAINSPDMTAALKEAKANGVSIRVMVNGGYGASQSDITSLQSDLAAAPGDGTVKLNWSSNNFNITHQKSVITDAVDKNGNAVSADALPPTAGVVISTGNFKAYYGSPFYAARDYDISTNDPGLVTKISAVFNSDFSCAGPTVVDPSGLAADDRLVWSNGTLGAQPKDPGQYPSLANGYPGFYDFPSSATDEGNSKASYLAVINSAEPKDVLRFSNEELTDQDIVNALTNAAAKGVDVRINMSLPYGFDPKNPTASQKTMWGIWQIVGAGGTAHMFTNNSDDPKALYIHAKMATVNSDRGFVGSENASTMSLEANRELGINLTSEDTQAMDTLVGTFDEDWAKGDAWVTVWTKDNVPTPNKPASALAELAPLQVDPRKTVELGTDEPSFKCGPIDAK